MGPIHRLLRGLPTPLGHRDDPSVQRDLNWQRRGDVALPAGLEVQWLGTAGFRLHHEGTSIVVDPYLSRCDLPTMVRAPRLLGDVASVDAHLGTVDAVLVGHTHFDHAVDVAHLVARDGCPAYGSTSLARLLSLHGLAELAVEVEPHRPYEVGPFEITFVPSRHSKLLAGLAVPAGGELTCDSLDDLGARAYRCGQVWGIRIRVAGTTLYHQGSADLIDEEIPPGGVDVFLCGIAGRICTPRFTERALRRLDPAVVVAHHHDDFFRPVGEPMGFSLNVNLGGFVEDVARVAPGVPVRTLEPLQAVRGT